MTVYGIYDLDGSETSLPHPLDLTASAYERLTEHYPEIGLWCIEHEMRIETVENTVMTEIQNQIAKLERDLKHTTGSREAITEKFVEMMNARFAYTLFFATPAEAFEFKVRWL